MVVARGITLASAIVLGERLRMALGLSVTNWNGLQLRVTTSVGVASILCTGQKRDKQTLIALADQRLYRAKELGRNRVIGA